MIVREEKGEQPIQNEWKHQSIYRKKRKKNTRADEITWPFLLPFLPVSVSPSGAVNQSGQECYRPTRCRSLFGGKIALASHVSRLELHRCINNLPLGREA